MSSPTHLTTGITTSSLLYNFLASRLPKVCVAFSSPQSARNVTSNEITGNAKTISGCETDLQGTAGEKL